MKKLVALLSIFFISTYSVYGGFNDLLYVKHDNTRVVSSPSISSQIMTKMKRGYIVLDQWSSQNGYTKVKLSSWDFWYIYETSLWTQEWNPIEVNGNGWILHTMTLLRNIPSGRWNPMGIVFSWNTFELLHPNFFNTQRMKVKVLDGRSAGKVWYIKSNVANIECSDAIRNVIMNSMFDMSSGEMLIPWINSVAGDSVSESFYCNRISEDNIEFNSAWEGDDGNDILDSLFNTWDNWDDNGFSTSDDDTDSQWWEDDFLGGFLDLLDDESNSDDSATGSDLHDDNEDDNNQWDEGDFLDAFEDILNGDDSSSSSSSSSSTSSTSSSSSSSSTSGWWSEDDFLDALNAIFE